MADRYAGLDIDYSSSKGKGKARAFDRSNIDTDADEDDYQHYSTQLKRVMRDLERSFCERDSLLDDWHDSNGDDSPLIYKSKFLCTYRKCTRGFLDHKAFENHKEEHDYCRVCDEDY